MISGITWKFKVIPKSGYHDEYKLFFDEMMMKSALYKTSHLVGFL